MESSALLTQAKKYIGQAEVPGPKSNSWIKDLWMNLKGGKWFWSTYGEDDSKLPWCGAFCAKVLHDLGIEYPAKYASALAWATYGTKSMHPTLGAIAVLTRSGGGHVGFVSAVTRDGKYVRLVGGNQGDAVSESWFLTNRVTCFVTPVGVLSQAAVFATVGTMSKSEA